MTRNGLSVRRRRKTRNIPRILGEDCDTRTNRVSTIEQTTNRKSRMFQPDLNFF